MAETWLLASKVLFAAAGCGAGFRLAQRARDASGPPLHAWASAMIFVGGVGLLGFGLGPGLAARSAELARWTMLVSDALERLTMLALAIFVWRFFGSGTPARAFLLSLSLVGMTASWTFVLLVQRWPEPMLDPVVQSASQLAFAAPFVWATVESWLERRDGRRQLALGLGDPEACHRSLLWTLGCGGFAASCFAAALAAFLPDGSPPDQALTAFRAGLYSAVSVVVALAFFPPGGYLRWIRHTRGAAAPPASTAQGRERRALPRLGRAAPLAVAGRLET
jgi:hypothetical protein